VTGEHLSKDVQALLFLLYQHRVRYLLVGGEAVIHYGYPRLTGDIDLFYDRSIANARRLYAALEEFWQGDVPALACAEELTYAELVVQFGRPPNRIDLLSSLGSVDFAKAWRRRLVEALKIRRKPIALPIISLSDLLQSKRDAGRHKDLDDIAVLSATTGPKRARATKKRAR